MTYDPAEFHRKRNERTKRSVEKGELSEKCAVCKKPATSWSGVEDWLVDGAWIGWCSSKCKNAWLSDPDAPYSSQSRGHEGMTDSNRHDDKASGDVDGGS